MVLLYVVLFVGGHSFAVDDVVLVVVANCPFLASVGAVVLVESVYCGLNRDPDVVLDGVVHLWEYCCAGGDVHAVLFF